MDFDGLCEVERDPVEARQQNALCQRQGKIVHEE